MSAMGRTAALQRARRGHAGEIASLLGLTIETVSRQLTKFENEGLIRRKGARGILLLDAGRLRELAS
jgi:CRP-like cAMP-binding protein